MSKEKCAKQELHNLLNQYIQNIKDSIKDNDKETLQAIFSAFINDTYHLNKEYEPFVQDFFHIHTLINTAPFNVVCFTSIEKLDFTVEEILEFQKEGRALISNLAKQVPRDVLEHKTQDCDNISTLMFSRESPQKILGHFTGNFVQDISNKNDRGK